MRSGGRRAARTSPSSRPGSSATQPASKLQCTGRCVVATCGVSDGASAVAIDVTPLLGARSGIGDAVARDRRRAARARGRARPRSVHAQHARPHACAPTCPPDTRFVPVARRALLQVVGALRRAAHRSLVAAGRRSCTRRTTSRRRAGSRRSSASTTARSSAIRSCARPRCARSMPLVRRAVARGATLHTGSEFVADEIEEIFGPGLRAAGRLVVIPLGVPPLGDDAPHAARRRGRRSAARRSSSRSARSNRARTSPHLVGAFGELAARPPRPPARDRRARRSGPARGRRRDRAAARRGARDRVVLAGSVDDAGRRALLERGDRARVPVDLRRLRLPAARSDDRRRAGRRGAGRVDPRSRGRRRAAGRTDRRARPRRRDGPRDHRRRDARGAHRARPRSGRRVLVGRHRARARRRATGGSRRRGDA